MLWYAHEDAQRRLAAGKPWLMVLITYPGVVAARIYAAFNMGS